MEERRLLTFLTVALALLALGGGFLAFRLNASKAGDRFRSRETAREAAMRGLSHAVACLNRRWPSEDCGDSYGPDYRGQARIAFSDGSSADVEVTTSASETRVLLSKGISPGLTSPESFTIRGEADIDPNELTASDSSPGLVESPRFGWRLREEALLELR